MSRRTSYHSSFSSIHKAGDGACTGRLGFKGWPCDVRSLGTRLIPIHFIICILYSHVLTNKNSTKSWGYNQHSHLSYLRSNALNRKLTLSNASRCTKSRSSGSVSSSKSATNFGPICSGDSNFSAIFSNPSRTRPWLM